MSLSPMKSEAPSDSRASPAEWQDLDTEEIASIASDELHEIRPNRWRGAKSTWRSLTNEETSMWAAIQRLEDQDLGIHLYNAFALKKRAKDPITAQDMMAERVSKRNKNLNLVSSINKTTSRAVERRTLT